LHLSAKAAYKRPELSLQAPYLLWKVVEDGGKAADVKRLNSVRDAFQVLDLEDPQSEETTHMMFMVCSTYNVLRIPEGRRCIASFFDLGSQIACDLLLVMKAQITMGKPAVLEAYGAIS
jgi:Condensin II non structural maintenance of chromosomes subunit